MKKIVLGIILGNLFVNSGLVFANEATSSSTTEFTDTHAISATTESIDSISATSTSTSVETSEDDVLYQQYLNDNRHDLMTFDEYQAFTKAMSTKANLRTMSATNTQEIINRATGERKQIVAKALNYLGSGYTQVYPDRLGIKAFDCSGLTYRVYKEVLNRDIGSYTLPQESSGTQIAVKDAKPGDLLFWGNRGATYHVAIYLGNSQYVHAPNYGQTVNVSPIYWNEFPPSFALRMNLSESNSSTTTPAPTTPAPTPTTPAIDLSKYWTTSPGKVANLKVIDYYRSPEFSSSTRVGTYALATRLDVSGIVKNKTGVPVLKLKNGYYVMAERYWMQKFTYASMKTTKYSISTDKTTLYKNITLMTAKSNSSRGKVFNVKGKYVLENGAVIYSLYNKNNTWAGYILNKDMIPVKYTSWNKKVVITKKNYSSYKDLFFSGKKISNTSSHLNKQYTAKGYYVLGNGRKYLSLYDKNNKWYGYLNANATKTVK
ncbi:NlpC/P60 family protein [Vagococcus zengguangii]|uniref:NlpC/P60 family protein n=1 Tax=Vagococcus zengguangii TaxID=2571750 RepID=UPI001109E264|nr:NlpC/P60 family protein [Vagococcus zengguangii]TLG80933.1 NlpC/P60 family protein [Vagococcus zengguangii]